VLKEVTWFVDSAAKRFVLSVFNCADDRSAITEVESVAMSLTTKKDTSAVPNACKAVLLVAAAEFKTLAVEELVIKAPGLGI
jgi:hypothetical protein